MIDASGIGTYIRGLLEAMHGGTGVEPSVDFTYVGDCRVLESYSPMIGCHEAINFPARPYSLREQVSFPRIPGIALTHFPHYNVPRFYRGRFVVTIHDLIHILLPEVLGSPFRRAAARNMISWATRRAARILTVSESTKRDLVEHLRIPATRVTVTPCGVSPRFQPVPLESIRAVRERLGLPVRYLLAVGINKPHKNLAFLIQTYLRWVQRFDGDVDLVVCGCGGDSLPKIERTEGRRRVHFLPYVRHDEMPAVYQAADALVFPSLYEGFGLPVLEAQRVGTPVIASNASSIPEVAGEGALYFSPTDSEELMTRLEEFYAVPSMAVSLRESGLANERRFSWEECARLTLACYKATAG